MDRKPALFLEIADAGEGAQVLDALLDRLERESLDIGRVGIGGRRLYDDLFLPETWNRAIDTAVVSKVR